MEDKRGKESDWKGLCQLSGEPEKSLLIRKFCMGKNLQSLFTGWGYTGKVWPPLKSRGRARRC